MTVKPFKSKSKEILAKEISRFPDFGPCDIEEWNGFLQNSEEFLKENWGKPFVHQETLSDFDQLTFLGSGSFGDVLLIKHKENGKCYAMKAIAKEKTVKLKQLVHVKNEKMTMQCINFPLTVYLLYFFQDNSYLYMVMPFIPGGELFSHLNKNGCFNEVEAKFYVCQVILAIEYLHYLNLIYRDLKPENILIDHTGYLKLTDFGFCKRLTKARTYTLCGTPEYLAPEVILSKGYGKSVDWWAIGVLMFELVAGKSPFYARDQIQIYERITTLKYRMPTSFSSELKDLVKNILQVDLTRRFGNLKNGVDDIKCHKWFKTIKWLQILNRKVKAPYQPAYKEPEKIKNSNHKLPLKIAEQNMYGDEFADF